MIQNKIKDHLFKHRCTLLGVGPMSINCVDAAVELANEYATPLMLIASRRQIDSEQFKGGYVNNWTTSEFANYVRNKDKSGNITGNQNQDAFINQIISNYAKKNQHDNQSVEEGERLPKRPTNRSSGNLSNNS